MVKKTANTFSNSAANHLYPMNFLIPVDRPIKIRVVGKWRKKDLRLAFPADETAIDVLPFRGVIDSEDHFILVRWSVDILEKLATAVAQAKESGCLPPILILHDEDQTPPVYIGTRATVSLPATVTAVEMLRAMTIAVFAPSAYQGVICCDYADFAFALSMPGRARIVTASDMDPTKAVQRLIESARQELMKLSNDSKVFVGITLPISACDLSLIALLATAIEDHAQPQTFIQFGMTPADTVFATISLVIIHS